MKTNTIAVGLLLCLQQQISTVIGFSDVLVSRQSPPRRFQPMGRRKSAEVEDFDFAVPLPPVTTIPTSTRTFSNDTQNAFSTPTLEASVSSTLPGQERPAGSLDLWKRRLITHEDPFSLHKLAAVAYTLSSAILLGTAALQAIKGDFASIPSAMEPMMHVFLASNIIMCGASVRMAFLHRQGDIAARNAFLGTAVSSLFSGYFMVWISPFPLGDVFNNLWISRACFAVLVALNGIFIMDTISNTEEVVEGRRDRKTEDYKGRKLIDTLGYVFPVAWGLPLIVATGFIASVMHDRPWLLEQCQFIDQMTESPGMQSHIFYQQLSTSLAASYASLFVTLRDKRLISKTQELAGISLFAFPALVWSVYTTVVFNSYLFVEH